MPVSTFFCASGSNLPSAGFIIFHENVVPDLQIFAAAARRVAVGPAGLLAGIYEHFAIRAAGAGYAGGTPPVVPFGQEE